MPAAKEGKRYVHTITTSSLQGSAAQVSIELECTTPFQFAIHAIRGVHIFSGLAIFELGPILYLLPKGPNAESIVMS